MRPLSKSKLLAYRQCSKRLWLELHRPELRDDSSAQAGFNVGYTVGELARALYDPKGQGTLIDVNRQGFDGAFAQTRALLDLPKPIFEAGFSAGGALAFADVMLPVKTSTGTAWRMVEVKSSGSIKDYYLDDTTIQCFVAREAEVRLVRISVAHIDTKWVYPGDGDYRGLLREVDVTDEAFGRAAEVKYWIKEAAAIADRRREPRQATGDHCTQPYSCGFATYCNAGREVAEFPISWIPRIQTNALKEAIASQTITDLRDVPDELLNESQARVKAYTLSGQTYFDARGALDDLKPNGLPAYYLDFETIQFAVPIWAGTRAFQQIPFQFSLHRLSSSGVLTSDGFLDLSGSDPSDAFAAALIAACGRRGPVYVYNAGFEKSRIRELADRFPNLASRLFKINDRVVDLWPIAKRRFYCPTQEGSWSIKKVLPAIAPHLNYNALEGVQDGGLAAEAYLEAIQPETSEARKAEIRQQLIAYCGLDTLALVHLWRKFSGSSLEI